MSETLTMDVREEGGSVIFEIKDGPVTLSAVCTPYQALAFSRGVTECVAKALENMEEESKC